MPAAITGINDIRKLYRLARVTIPLGKSQNRRATDNNAMIPTETSIEIRIAFVNLDFIRNLLLAYAYF